MSEKLHLTEPQQRHVETVLRLVDQAVQQVEFLLDRAARHAGPSGIHSSLSEETIRAVREELRRLQDEAVRLYHRYGGRARRLDLDRVLDAELSALWEMLEDTRPGQMRGYGPMDKETARQLEADIAPLIELVLQTRRLVLSSVEKGKQRGAR